MLQKIPIGEHPGKYFFADEVISLAFSFIVPLRACGVRNRKSRTSVVLPAPDGAEITNSLPLLFLAPDI
jgi:hypothetical protein